MSGSRSLPEERLVNVKSWLVAEDHVVSYWGDADSIRNLDVQWQESTKTIFCSASVDLCSIWNSKILHVKWGMTYWRIRDPNPTFLETAVCFVDFVRRWNLVRKYAVKVSYLCPWVGRAGPSWWYRDLRSATTEHVAVKFPEDRT